MDVVFLHRQDHLQLQAHMRLSRIRKNKNKNRLETHLAGKHEHQLQKPSVLAAGLGH
jgi:hypothetical protein